MTKSRFVCLKLWFLITSKLYLQKPNHLFVIFFSKISLNIFVSIQQAAFREQKLLLSTSPFRIIHTSRALESLGIKVPNKSQEETRQDGWRHAFPSHGTRHNDIQLWRAHPYEVVSSNQHCTPPVVWCLKSATLCFTAGRCGWSRAHNGFIVTSYLWSLEKLTNPRRLGDNWNSCDLWNSVTWWLRANGFSFAFKQTKFH